MTRDTNAQLPSDQNSSPIQALSPDDANVTVTSSTAGGTSAAAISGLVAGQANIVEVAAATDIHMSFGGSGLSTSTVSSRLFTKGVAVYKLTSAQTHFSVITAATGTDAKVTITPLN